MAYAMAPYYMVPAPTPLNTGSSPYMPGAPPPQPQGVSPLPPPSGADRQKIKTQVQGQIEYYFSQDNLLKDVYLRSRMNEEGWISLDILAGFRRVQQMTTDLGLIIEAI